MHYLGTDVILKHLAQFTNGTDPKGIPGMLEFFKHFKVTKQDVIEVLERSGYKNPEPVIQYFVNMNPILLEWYNPDLYTTKAAMDAAFAKFKEAADAYLKAGGKEIPTYEAV